MRSNKYLHGVFVAQMLLAGPAPVALAAGGVPENSKEALFDLGPGPTAENAQAKTKESLPVSRDALFDDVADEKKPKQSGSPASAELKKEAKEAASAPLADSKAALFDDVLDVPKANTPPSQEKSGLRGYAQTEFARTFAGPGHWSKALGRVELGSQGRLQSGGQWKVSGRVDYNAVFDRSDFYQVQVRDDQRAEFHLRETYVDVSTGEWDWRLGRQNIVWGEMVGMFLADVVSAKDMREFILPDFQVLRIPQWAARAEYFVDDFHAEVVWIPFPSYDLIGKPANFAIAGSGADFYPYPPVPNVPTFLKEEKPSTNFDHGNFGVRLSRLKNGWDTAGFYYTSMNTSATYYQVAPDTYLPRHDRIWQLGGSVAKDLGPVVLKAEAVYTHGRKFNRVTTGVPVEQQMLDWAVGLDFNPDADTRVNTQFFQSRIFDHDAAILPDEAENGVSLYVSRALPNKWRAELLWMRSLNRADWLVRPKAIWSFQPNWKMTLGVDVFSGPPTGFFGQYDQLDRGYAEVRYDF